MQSRRSLSTLIHLSALTALGLVLLLAGADTLAQDVIRPASIADLEVNRGASDVALSWTSVSADVAGGTETIDHYNIYRGTTPDFVPDLVGGSNLIGSSPTASFSDPGAALDNFDYYYRVTAVDADGNESNSKAPLVTTPPTLSGFWTNTSIEIDWTDADPIANVFGYRVYHGPKSGEYDTVVDVNLVTTHSLGGLPLFKNRYIVVTAIDDDGNESGFSNEHIDVIRGIVRTRAHDGEELCWGNDCTPSPGVIQRSSGWQALVPIDFPEGDWSRVLMTFTMESRLCTPPNGGNVTKCGSGNPCVSPPCNGGYNTCGDPWDRLAHVFMVLDDCIDAGGSCITHDNLELMRAVTSFGTDAEPPEGTGFVPPRELTLDITPYTPLLTGERYIGVEIGHFVQKGHWVTVDFEFSKRPDQISSKPPADGIQILGFGNAPLPTIEATVPLEATQVFTRLFTTGHGGGLACSGGTNNGNPCSSGAQCPGGVCNPCDEFCHRTNTMSLDGQPIWSWVPWRTDCNPGPSCATWNACGFPSCTFPRSGWCPGYIACHHNAPCDQDLDMTFDIPPGGTYNFDYGITPKNGSWPISLVLYWYE
jgi:hypothetical protein